MRKVPSGSFATLEAVQIVLRENRSFVSPARKSLTHYTGAMWGYFLTVPKITDSIKQLNRKRRNRKWAKAGKWESFEKEKISEEIARANTTIREKKQHVFWTSISCKLETKTKFKTRKKCFKCSKPYSFLGTLFQVNFLKRKKTTAIVELCINAILKARD